MYIQAWSEDYMQIQWQINATECQFRHSQSKSMDPNICKQCDFIERSEEALVMHVKEFHTEKNSSTYWRRRNVWVKH